MLVILNSLSTLNSIRLQLWIKLSLLIWMGCKKNKIKSVRRCFCPPVTAVITKALKTEVACPEFVLGTEYCVA